MIVVSDTSPIANLAVIGKLDILKQLYKEIVIPRAVACELRAGGIEVKNFDFIKEKEVIHSSLVEVLKIEVDEGEAEAIAISKEIKANILLIDERKGRDVADRLNIRNIGLIGAIINAKQKNLVSEVKPIIDELREKAGFWISDKLYIHILEHVKEKSS